MAVILGVFAEGPNPAACILYDGTLVAFAEEERFVRLKTATGLYPRHAIEYCLRAANVKCSELTGVAFAWDATKYRSDGIHSSYMQQFYGELADQYTKDEITLSAEERILARFCPQRIADRLRETLAEIGSCESTPPIYFVSHHSAHAASAFYASGFDGAIVVTADGAGEDITCGVWRGDGLKLELLYKESIPHSLGWFYGAFTEYLGLRPYFDEGSVMALAAYGHAETAVDRVVHNICGLRRDGRGYHVDPYYTFYGGHKWGRRFTDRLVNELGEPRNVRQGITGADADVAYSVQHRLEEILGQLVIEWSSIVHERRVCMAGGVMLNCKMNGHVLSRLQEINGRLFVQPVSSDAGSALGAAMNIAIRFGDDPRFEMRHLRWGPSFSSDACRAALDRSGVSYIESQSVAGDVAEHIAQGAVVGWFQGRAEVGPRALGNRSILADARSVRSPAAVNSKVKRRDHWRPFAPSIRDDFARRALVSLTDSPFMILAGQVAPSHRGLLPAVLHVDGTTRPHTVDDYADPLYRELLDALEVQIGVPAVLNTSFNEPGEPIVLTPDDAVIRFANSEMDVLALDKFIAVREVGMMRHRVDTEATNDALAMR